MRKLLTLLAAVGLTLSLAACEPPTKEQAAQVASDVVADTLTLTLAAGELTRAINSLDAQVDFMQREVDRFLATAEGLTPENVVTVATAVKAVHDYRAHVTALVPPGERQTARSLVLDLPALCDKWTPLAGAYVAARRVWRAHPEAVDADSDYFARRWNATGKTAAGAMDTLCTEGTVAGVGLETIVTAIDSGRARATK